jgi:hypothetical protein
MATTLIAKIAARAKVIRAKNPKMTWQSALKKAGAELKGTTVKTTSKRPTIKAKRKPTVKRKSKVGDPIYNAYKRAPITVKKIIDQLGDEPDYDDLKKAAAALKRKGWFMDYGLDAAITALRPIKKTTIKKVGATTLLPEHKPYFKKLSLQAARKRYNNNKEVYGLRYDGSEALITQKNDFNNSEFYAFGYEIESVGKTTKIAVKKPKIEKAAVNMDALNGVIKFASGKFYEVVAGANKGSVVKITSIKRPTNKKEGSMLLRSYNVDFYEKRNGVLQKPFKGSITERWLNKRSIRPRLSVKANEYKKFI